MFGPDVIDLSGLPNGSVYTGVRQERMIVWYSTDHRHS